MEPITRRTALTLGGIGVVAAAAGGTALWWNATSTPGTAPDLAPSQPQPTTPTADSFRQPTVLRSSGGRLDVALVAAPTSVVIGTTTVAALTYSGGLPGPTLIVRPGDVLGVTLENQLADPTNLHTHGLHVSPEGSSDNVFLRIDPGASAAYSYELPANHPPGVYWYHPHHHGMAAEQVFGGLYGAIIVEELIPLDVTTERVLVISDITFDSAGQVAGASRMDQMNGREGTTVLLNGQTGSSLAAASGDRERWRIINACSSRYLRLTLDGQAMQLLGMDSGRFATPRGVTQLDLMPGNRADVLVTMASGTSILRVLPVDRGSAGMGSGSASSSTSVLDLATVVVGAAAGSAPGELSSATPPRDLRSETVSGRRTLTLAMGGGGMGGGQNFTIDGKSFDETRIDQQVPLGGVEEWTITNTSSMDHPFHLHVWPMQVISIGGDSPSEPHWQDVVNVPARASTVVRIAFEDFGGKAVYHCHILDHEDNGMMGVIEVS